MTNESVVPVSTEISFDYSPARLMIFDLDYRGHHAGYIKHLVQYWRDHNLPGHLDVLVSNKFIQQHTDVIELARERQDINFISIDKSEEKMLVDSETLGDSFFGRIHRAFQELKILHQYTKQLKTTHCLIMYLDSIFLRLSFGDRLSCNYSCIYFRPVFHYRDFEGYEPANREGLWILRDRICLQLLMRSKRLTSLMCLDNFAVDHLNSIDRKKRSSFLQDPVQVYTHSDKKLQALKTDLGISESRKIFLLFGVLSSRKGIRQTLQALHFLSRENAEKTCVLLVGPISADEKAYVEEQTQLLSEKSAIQIIPYYHFIQDSDVQLYFQLSDVILVPYQRHIGMSAVLVRAATAGKPVISSNFGLIGEITRKQKLGLAIDSSDPKKIADAMEHFLVEESHHLYSKASMKSFAKQNLAQDFSAKVFKQLGYFA